MYTKNLLILGMQNVIKSHYYSLLMGLSTSPGHNQWNDDPTPNSRLLLRLAAPSRMVS